LCDKAGGLGDDGLARREKMERKLLNQLHRIAEHLKKEYHAEKVILYGSYATGTATEDSDVDLFVLAPTNQRFFERMATVRKLIRTLRNGLPVSPIVLTPQEVEERMTKGDQFVTEILEAGITL
jgi:predicted nucleotidyltransferase